MKQPQVSILIAGLCCSLGLLTACSAGTAGSGTAGSVSGSSDAAVEASSGSSSDTIVNGVDVSDSSLQAYWKGEDVQSLAKGHTDGGDPVHDPSIIKDPETGTYWLFGTHMEVAKSDDLNHWTKVYSGENRYNKLFSNLWAEDSDAFSWVGKNEEGGYSVWAPCVIYNKAMQKYCMYFCTSSTYIKSSLCWATSDTLKGPYDYQGRLLDSGWNGAGISKGLVDIMDYYSDIKEVRKRYMSAGAYNNLKWPNCIDPTVFYDKDGRMWMTYGSWSGGVFILEIDESTGLPIHPETNDETETDCYFGRHLVGGNHQSCEGPWIEYDADSGYYYLFVSYGSLTAHGGYQIRLYRSDNPDGPYVDPQGQTLDGEDNKTFGLKMMGNYTFPSLDCTYMAPGHNSMFRDDDGKKYVVYHQRFDNGTENFEPRVHQLFLNEDGWYTAAPFQQSGETLPEEGYPLSQVCGTYYYLNHGLNVDDTVPEDAQISLQPDGNIYEVGTGTSQEENTSGSVAATNSAVPLGTTVGSFSRTEGTPYVTLTIDGTAYKGVFIAMNDEAGNPVMCFTASADNNETIWGVHYGDFATVSQE